MKKMDKIRKMGFTIIELLVTISIMALLTIAVLPGLRTLDRKNQLAVASADINSGILQAKSYAMAPRPEDKSVKDFGRYAFKIYNNGNYEIDYVTNASTGTGFNTKVITSGKIPSGVVVDNLCPSSDSKKGSIAVGFTVGDGKVSFDNSFDFGNVASGSKCVPTATLPAIWTSNSAAIGYIFLKDSGATCSKYGNDPSNLAQWQSDPDKKCAAITINSFSGQVKVE